MSLSEPLLKITALSQQLGNPHFGNGFCVKVPELLIEKNDFMVVTGPTGCGKSTLFNVIATLERPTSVSLHEFQGVDIFMPWGSKSDIREIRRRFISCAPQRPELIASLTVSENIALPLKLNGLDKIDARVNRLLDGFGHRDASGKSDLRRIAHQRPKNISGGQAQRVALARAVAHSPALLCCDEGTSNLDPKMKRKVLKFLQRLREEEDLTILFITHDKVVTQFANVLVQMSANRGVGRIVRCTRRAETSNCQYSNGTALPFLPTEVDRATSQPFPPATT